MSNNKTLKFRTFKFEISEGSIVWKSTEKKKADSNQIFDSEIFNTIKSEIMTKQFHWNFQRPEHFARTRILMAD